MPHVSIEAEQGVLHILQKDSLKGYLRVVLPEMFSVDELQLTHESFSFSFPAFDEGTELSHDVIMRIRLHPFSDRLLQASMQALQLQEGITESLYESVSPHLELRVGVCLDFGIEIVWCDENGLA